MDTQIKRWPIERSWVVLSSKGAPKQVQSSNLLGYHACGMLGAAGLGKTYELSCLANLDRQRGLDVCCERLAELGQTADGLTTHLAILANQVRENTAIYLDALDEVMIPVKTTGLISIRPKKHMGLEFAEDCAKILLED